MNLFIVERRTKIGRCDCHEKRGWQIMLPGVVPWCTLDRTSQGLWGVSGEAPKLTVTPSIHVIGGWHGWITDGVLTPA